MDIIKPDQRSKLMSRIRGKNTKPELIVRRVAHSMGFRFRLHRRDLPGTPDLVFPRHKKIIFVHGCFWHRHANCKYAYAPKSNTEFWNKKFQKNICNDELAQRLLTEHGWAILIIWECEIKDLQLVSTKIHDFLSSKTEL